MIFFLLNLFSCSSFDGTSDGDENFEKLEDGKNLSERNDEDPSTGDLSISAEDEFQNGSTDLDTMNEYEDQEGYERFLTVSAYDDVLWRRGFKDVGANSDYLPLNYDVMKAVWISQYDFTSVYCEGSSQRSVSEFRIYVSKAYENLKSLGFNTVIVQVRPGADSFYPSAYYPWSHYVTGSYGDFGKYDPIEIMIDLAHKKGLSFQAWINPMRGMTPEDMSKISDIYFTSAWAKAEKGDEWERYLFDYNDLYYLNIAYEEVRDLIIEGAAEIVRNYDVDGIHMDDYFYFGEVREFDNKEYAYARRKQPALTLRDFRYQNLNSLVSGIYSAIKAENDNVIFGISPAGNLNSMETSYYADVKTWLSEDGYVDYIMPQIYFGMEHQNWSFSATYERWSEITTNPNIRFMAGMSLGKAIMGYNGTIDKNAGTGQREWIENKDVLKRCFEYSLTQENYSGYAMFCYKYLFDPLTGKPAYETVEELENCKDYLIHIINGRVMQ